MLLPVLRGTFKYGQIRGDSINSSVNPVEEPSCTSISVVLLLQQPSSSRRTEEDEMASVTFYQPTPTLPAIITNPPTAQFTPGPGCVDPEDNWVVVTSCFAIALGQGQQSYSSPDWLTCQVTQFGPPQNGPSSCFLPWEAGTAVNEVTTYFSGCPSGYSAAATTAYSYSLEDERQEIAYCCPTQYPFVVNNVDAIDTTTERDGVTWSIVYPLPRCAASYVDELSGKQLAVQTAYNTYGWEKRQVANVQWDYLYDTLYAEMIYQSYTVFHGTHTCYEFVNCFSWHSYYFSGGPMPSFTVPDNIPAQTTPVEDPAPTSSISEVETPSPEQTPPVETPPVEQPSTSPADGQNTPTPTEEDSSPSTSSIESLPTLTILPGGSSGNGTSPSQSSSSSSTQSPSSTESIVPEGAAGVIAPSRVIFLGFLLSFVLSL
ncbi:hypothetical protein GGR51DRAFT_497386 [Nemania sp. FL0031]|nr:hypothetical protein GGR51DRAFT_497386 [Nemania sp. FL0031]